MDPVITLIVRAYDLGIPSMDAEVPVHIYTDDIFTRTMRFIIPETPEVVDSEQEKIRCVEIREISIILEFARLDASASVNAIS